MATELSKQEEGVFTEPTKLKGKIHQAMIAVAQQREIAEVQSKLIIARGNLRDRKGALDRILQECTNTSLAEKALFTYSRGGIDITGESIRLAEVMAQNWGNFEFGIRELEQRDGESTVEAYAWDLETNVSQRKIFQVPHIRYSRAKGNTKLSDPRDIYELVANSGARRMRACILGMIPPDVKEAAVAKCEETLVNKIKITPELIQRIVGKFGDFAVTKEMIEKRIRRRMESITPRLVIQLGKIANSLIEGMSKPSDWFEFEYQKPNAEKGTLDLSDMKPKESNPEPEHRGPGRPRKQRSATAMENPEYAEGSDPDPIVEREPGMEG